jgi:signal transduction histidine kinase
MFRWIKERRKAARSLELMDRERQEFYRGVTHQLRTPLTVVLGMT